MKKILITIIALIAISAAVYGIWRWEKTSNNQPIRQEQEIR